MQLLKWNKSLSAIFDMLWLDQSLDFMEDTTPSYEQLYMDHQRVLAEYYRDSVDFHKQIIQLKDELAEVKLQLASREKKIFDMSSDN